jgi:hypothetical protein
MNILLFAVLLTTQLVSLMYIIPNYVSAEKQQVLKNWIQVAFPGLILFISLFQASLTDVSIPIGFYLFVIGFCLSGVYWWIPTYVKPTEQTNAITWMFLSATLATTLSNILTPAIKITKPKWFIF